MENRTSLLQASRTVAAVPELTRWTVCFMKYALLGTTALAALIAASVLGYRWDSSINRGHTWGYWGEFNTISNSLAKLPGVKITAPWYNPDVTLEEFGFDVVVQGHQVKLAFGEKDPIRNLSGGRLQKALIEQLVKQSSNHSMQRIAASRLAESQSWSPRRLAPTADGGR
jgi:hypothetical protein